MKLHLLVRLLAILAAALLLAGCGTLGGLVEGAGSAVEKAGQAVKRI